MVLWKLIAAYTIGTLVWTVSPIPQGIGLVEGAYSLVLVSLGIRAPLAATIALAYRGIVFWLPLLAGIIALKFIPGYKNPNYLDN